MSGRQLEFEQVKAINPYAPGEYRLGRSPGVGLWHPRIEDPNHAVEGTAPEWQRTVLDHLQSTFSVVGITVDPPHGRIGYPYERQTYWNRGQGTIGIQGDRFAQSHAYLNTIGPEEYDGGVYRMIHLFDKSAVLQESPPGVWHREDATFGGGVALDLVQMQEPALWKGRVHLRGTPGKLPVAMIEHINETVKDRNLPLWKLLQKD